MNTKLTAAVLAASLALSVLPVAAQTTASTTGGNASTTPKSPAVAIDVACLSTAADALTQSLTTAYNTLAQAMTSSFSVRGAAWKAALALTNVKARRQAVLAADRQFNVSARAARKAYGASRATAWGQFRSARKACTGGSAAPLPSGAGESE